MKSSNASYDCRIDLTPGWVDRALAISACGSALCGVSFSGLSWPAKFIACALLITTTILRLRSRQEQRVEWWLSRSLVMRVRRDTKGSLWQEVLDDASVECVGCWVRLRGRVEGRLQYALIWPWHTDLEQYRRLRRLASRYRTSPVLEPGV